MMQYFFSAGLAGYRLATHLHADVWGTPVHRPSCSISEWGNRTCSSRTPNATATGLLHI